MASTIYDCRQTHIAPIDMKHVWILNHYAQEPGGAGGTRHFSLARHLSSYGWKATIIAASTDHSTGLQRLNAGETQRLQTYDGVPFLWLKTRGYSGNGMDRVANMFDYTRAVLNRRNLSSLDPPDAIIGSSVHPLAAWAGRKLAKRHGVPFVFEVRDLWPQTLIDMGRLSDHHPAAVGLRWLEKSLYRAASRIIVLLPHAHEYIEPLGIAREKIVWIPNGTDTDSFGPKMPITESAKFTLMYFGAHGAANGLDNLLSAMQIVAKNPKGDRICLRLIGDGPLKPSLMAAAKTKGLTNVEFEDPVPKNDIPALAAQADAFVLCLRDFPKLYRFGISMNKIFDYLASGRPIIISIDAANDPIKEASAGISVSPENPEAFAKAIIQIASLPLAQRIEMGTSGRRHLEQSYNMRLLASRLAHALDTVISQ